MGDDDIRRQMLTAAESFPLRGRPADVHERVVVRRRRVAAGFAVAAVIVVAAGVTGVVAVAQGGPPGPDRAESQTFAAGAGYVGSSWRLTLVTDGESSTTVPADVGARLDLFPDGRVFVDNGVNLLSGTFAASAGGFEVRDVGSTFVLYGGNDPRRLAAIAALNTLAYGNRDGVTPSGPVHDTVVSADGSRLVVQAGSFRLSFERAGAPSTSGPDRPAASGKAK